MTREEARAELDRRKIAKATSMGVPEGLRAPTETEIANQPKPVGPEAPGIGETIVRHGTEGAALGFGSEATAAVEHGIAQLPGVRDASAWLSEKMGDSPDRVARQMNPDISYSERRDANQARNDAAAKANPATAILSNVGGAIASAPVMGAAKGMQAIKAGAKFGAIQGLGTSDADLTEGDIGGALKDTAMGGVVGGVLGGAVEGVKAGAKAIGSSVTSGLRQRIIREAGEGVADRGSAKLNKAGGAIADEVISGPDGATLRAAWRGDPEKGRQALAPIIDKIGKSTDANYELLEKAGKGQIDLARLDKTLLAAENELANTRGQGPSVASAVGEFRKHVAEVASKYGNGLPEFQVNGTTVPGAPAMNLKLMRATVTDAQKMASPSTAALEISDKKAILGKVAALAKEALSDQIDDSAVGNPALQAAAKTIRESNRRMYALLTVDETLEAKVKKNAPNVLMKAMTSGAALPAAAGVVSAGAQGGDWQDKAQNMAIGMAATKVGQYGVPAAIRAIRGATTTAAINAAKGGLDEGAKRTQAAVRDAAVRIAEDPKSAQATLWQTIFGDGK